MNRGAPDFNPATLSRTSHLQQAEPARQLKNLKGIPLALMTRDTNAGGNTFAQFAFLKQAGCTVDWIRMTDVGFADNSNLFMLDKNNKQTFMAARDWFVKQGF